MAEKSRSERTTKAKEQPPEEVVEVEKIGLYRFFPCATRFFSPTPSSH